MLIENAIPPPFIIIIIACKRKPIPFGQIFIYFYNSLEDWVHPTLLSLRSVIITFIQLFIKILLRYMYPDR